MKALVAALVFLAAAPAAAHRLDEYLQQTTISVEKGRVQAQMVLTPGAAAPAFVLARIDANGDGVLSEAEQQGYARQVLRDVSLKLDGERLPLTLAATRFDRMDTLREGRGSIGIDFEAEVHRRGGQRRLTLENRHQPLVGAYLVNALVPQDPDVRISAQDRSFDQSSYTLDYVDAGSAAALPAHPVALWSWLVIAAALMFAFSPRLWRTWFALTGSRLR